jgi:hypothetical protein
MTYKERQRLEDERRRRERKREDDALDDAEALVGPVGSLGEAARRLRALDDDAWARDLAMDCDDLNYELLDEE